MQNNISNPSAKIYKDTKPEEKVLYFGFGSNVNTTTHKWRRFQCETKFPCILYDHKLTFDVPGFPFVEGSFGNVKPCAGESVHGLGFEMSKSDFIGNIKNKEGSHYEVVDIKVESYQDKKVYNAITLIVPSTDGKYAYPSRRYLDLIIKGAEEHSFDPKYVEYLKRFPDVKNSLTVIGLILRIFFMMFYIAPFICFVLFRKCNNVGGGKLHKLIDMGLWPFRAIPALPFTLLPRNVLIKPTVSDPMENRFKYKKD